MNKYRVWVAGIRDETAEDVRAVSSFEARRAKAAKHDVGITDVCSIRNFIDENGKDMLDRYPIGRVTERNVK